MKFKSILLNVLLVGSAFFLLLSCSSDDKDSDSDSAPAGTAVSGSSPTSGGGQTALGTGPTRITSGTGQIGIQTGIGTAYTSTTQSTPIAGPVPVGSATLSGNLVAVNTCAGYISDTVLPRSWTEVAIASRTYANIAMNSNSPGNVWGKVNVTLPDLRTVDIHVMRFYRNHLGDYVGYAFHSLLNTMPGTMRINRTTLYFLTGNVGTYEGTSRIDYNISSAIVDGTFTAAEICRTYSTGGTGVTWVNGPMPWKTTVFNLTKISNRVPSTTLTPTAPAPTSPTLIPSTPTAPAPTAVPVITACIRDRVFGETWSLNHVRGAIESPDLINRCAENMRRAVDGVPNGGVTITDLGSILRVNVPHDGTVTQQAVNNALGFCGIVGFHVVTCP